LFEKLFNMAYGLLPLIRASKTSACCRVPLLISEISFAFVRIPLMQRGFKVYTDLARKF